MSAQLEHTKLCGRHLDCPSYTHRAEILCSPNENIVKYERSALTGE